MANNNLGYTTENNSDMNYFVNGSNYSRKVIDTEVPEWARWSFEFSVIIAILMCMSAIINIVGNSMVLTVIARHRGMRTRTNLFLVNLAVADLLVGILVMPVSITTLIQGKWIFGTGFICQLNSFLNSFCLVTSFHTLTYIGIHKYFSILRPLKNPLNLKIILSMMAAAWVWAAIIGTMTVAGLKADYKDGTSQCGPKYPHDMFTYLIHAIIQVTCLIAPFLILIFVYGRMFVAIRDHMKRMSTNSTVAADTILEQQKRVTITMFIVVSCFFIMILPYLLYSGYVTFVKDKHEIPTYYNPMAYLFLFFNSMCNPIIYAFRSPSFREGYKEILCQTPNYVITDGTNKALPRMGRLSSLFGEKRLSVQSTHSVNNPIVHDRNHISSLCSLQMNGHKAGAKRLTKQKSLFDILRSTRQLNVQSVVQINGDIIIMKGGKIVSVRRESTKRKHLLKKLKAIADADSVRDRDLEMGLSPMCQTGYTKSSDNTSSSKGFVLRMNSETASKCSGDEFLPHQDKNIIQNGETIRYKDNDFINKNVDEGFDEDVATTKRDMSTRTHDPQTWAYGPPEGLAQSAACMANYSNLRQNTQSNLSSSRRMGSSLPYIIISEESEELTCKPLYQKCLGDPLSKSDNNISSNNSDLFLNGDNLLNPLNVQLRHTRSTENIKGTHIPPFERTPSLEYLTPPESLFKTLSSASMKLKKRLSKKLSSDKK